VRRDGCKLLSRVQEKCLRELFETKDLSRVKRYLQVRRARNRAAIGPQ
jgi:DNA polymerase elongation subunit (family B)